MKIFRKVNVKQKVPKETIGAGENLDTFQIEEIRISMANTETNQPCWPNYSDEKNNDENTNEFSLLSQITAMIIVIFYNFYPRIMLNAIDLLRFVRIDDSNQTYMVRNIDIECWGADHTMIIVILTLSNILVWGITIPLLLLYLTILS